MAPKRQRPKARAKAKAREERKKSSQKERRSALMKLNTLATEHSLDEKRISRRDIRSSPTPKKVYDLIRLLEPRCAGSGSTERLRTAVQKWQDNGGKMLQPLAEEVDSTQQEDVPVLPLHRILQPGFILRSKAFMVTFNSPELGLDDWPALEAWAKERAKTLSARAWAACLEETDPHHARGGPLRFHGHAYFYWTDGVGLYRRELSDLKFRDIWPRVDKCAVRKDVTPRTAACHGLWYVTVMKAGTRHSGTNYKPWVHYKPNKTWLQDLWDGDKLTHDQYLNLSMSFRTGHPSRKRDAEEVRRSECDAAARKLVDEELAILKENSPLREFNVFPEVERFVAAFRERGRWRRPLLVLVGATQLGKSFLARAVLRRLCEILDVESFLEVTVEDDETLDFSGFMVNQHAGVLFDGVADVRNLLRHREVLQGQPKVTKGGKSRTMIYAYEYTLCRRAVVVTCDLSAANLHLLRYDHWLSNPENVLTCRLEVSVWLGGPVPARAPARERMSAWSVGEVAAFLRDKDLAGPAAYLADNGVNGEDLYNINLETLTQDLRCTPFAARKVLHVRNSFLQNA